jgi:hypothetical protein
MVRRTTFVNRFRIEYGGGMEEAWHRRVLDILSYATGFR